MYVILCVGPGGGDEPGHQDRGAQQDQRPHLRLPVTIVCRWWYLVVSAATEVHQLVAVLFSFTYCRNFLAIICCEKAMFFLPFGLLFNVRADLQIHDWRLLRGHLSGTEAGIF